MSLAAVAAWAGPLTENGTQPVLNYPIIPASNCKEYVDFLLAESTTHSFADDCIERTSGFPNQTRAEILHDMWTTYGKAPPVDMESDTALINTVAATPGEASGSTPMLVTAHDGAGNIDLGYDVACEASDHTVYYGSLSNVSTMTFSGQACALGDTGLPSSNVKT